MHADPLWTFPYGRQKKPWRYDISIDSFVARRENLIFLQYLCYVEDRVVIENGWHVQDVFADAIARRAGVFSQSKLKPKNANKNTSLLY